MQAHLTALLLGHAPLSDLVADRVHWLRLPPGVADRPYLILQTVSDGADYHSKGASGLHRDRVQIDAWADSAGDALAVHRAVEALLSGYSAAGNGADLRGVFHAGGRDLDDNTTGGEARLFRRSDDYIINWKVET